MARVPITVMGYRCERCGHEWIPRGDLGGDPKACQKCKSTLWNKPRKASPALTYESFRDAIQLTLLDSDLAMTWTEIRTRARLPQLFPNNVWVRRMETDVGLIRARDTHGIIRWQLKKLEDPNLDASSVASTPD